MKRTWVLLAVIAAICIGGLAWWSITKPSDNTLAGRNKVTLQLQWFPQAQFIGFYVAQAKNYYADEGLLVEFRHGGPDVDPIKAVAQGESQIGLATADQVLIWTDRNKSPQTRLKAIGTVFNRSIACFMSKTVLNIDSPQQFRGKTVGVYPSYDTENLLLALLHKHNIPESQLKVAQFPSFVQFEDDSVQVFPAYRINEPLLAQLKNIPVNCLDPSKFGVQFYSDTIITRGEYYDQNREILKKFLRASSRGWSYAQQNPDEALKLMYQVVRGAIGEGLPKEHQAMMLNEAVKFIGAGPDNLNFFMEKSKWDSMEEDLLAIKRISRTGLVGEVCDFKIVDEARQ